MSHVQHLEHNSQYCSQRCSDSPHTADYHDGHKWAHPWLTQPVFSLSMACGKKSISNLETIDQGSCSCPINGAIRIILFVPEDCVCCKANPDWLEELFDVCSSTKLQQKPQTSHFRCSSSKKCKMAWLNSSWLMLDGKLKSRSSDTSKVVNQKLNLKSWQQKCVQINMFHFQDPKSCCLHFLNHSVK